GARALSGGLPRQVRQPLRRRRARLHRRGDPAARDAPAPGARAGAPGQQARQQPAQEARKHPAMKRAPLARDVLVGVAAALACAAGCATTVQPVTKIVDGRVIVTRSVSPDAYEHVTRALLYEEEERWDEAATELQRALPFDDDAAELRAHLA